MSTADSVLMPNVVRQLRSSIVRQQNSSATASLMTPRSMFDEITVFEAIRAGK
jgi:hypothetical protein